MFHENRKKMSGYDYFIVKDYFEKLDFKIDLELVLERREMVDVIISINKEKTFVEIRKEVRPQHIPIFKGIKEDNAPLLVVSGYITPKAKEALKNENINYLDSFGNVFLSLKELKIYIEKGNSHPIINQRSNILTVSGGQLLFQFLKNPEIVNETYRYLTEISKVSLGSVSKIMNSLQNEGFLVRWKKEKKYQLVRKRELLDKWVSILNEKVLPTYQIGRYQFSSTNNNWKELSKRNDVQWAGEAGANLLTDYLYPGKFTLFTELPNHKIITELRMLPNNKGDIIIYRPFWNLDNENNYFQNNIVNPLIIYAQLIYNGDSRSRETAEIIFNKYVRIHI